VDVDCHLKRQEQADKINDKMTDYQHFDVPVLLIISPKDQPDENGTRDIYKCSVTEMGQAKDQARQDDWQPVPFEK
jgi:hypothetical protein